MKVFLCMALGMTTLCLFIAIVVIFGLCIVKLMRKPRVEASFDDEEDNVHVIRDRLQIKRATITTGIAVSSVILIIASILIIVGSFSLAEVVDVPTGVIQHLYNSTRREDISGLQRTLEEIIDDITTGGSARSKSKTTTNSRALRKVVERPRWSINIITSSSSTLKNGEVDTKIPKRPNSIPAEMTYYSTNVILKDLSVFSRYEYRNGLHLKGINNDSNPEMPFETASIEPSKNGTKTSRPKIFPTPPTDVDVDFKLLKTVVGLAVPVFIGSATTGIYLSFVSLAAIVLGAVFTQCFDSCHGDEYHVDPNSERVATIVKYSLYVNFVLLWVFIFVTVTGYLLSPEIIRFCRNPLRYSDPDRHYNMSYNELFNDYFIKFNGSLTNTSEFLESRFFYYNKTDNGSSGTSARPWTYIICDFKPRDNISQALENNTVSFGVFLLKKQAAENMIHDPETQTLCANLKHISVEWKLKEMNVSGDHDEHEMLLPCSAATPGPTLCWIGGFIGVLALLILLFSSVPAVGLYKIPELTPSIGRANEDEHPIHCSLGIEMEQQEKACD